MEKKNSFVSLPKTKLYIIFLKQISAYGRRGFSSTTAASADGELSSNPPISQETSSKSSKIIFKIV